MSLCHHQNTSKMLPPSLICLVLSGFNNSLILITYYGKKDCYDLLYKVLFSKDQCKDLVFISKFMIYTWTLRDIFWCTIWKQSICYLKTSIMLHSRNYLWVFSHYGSFIKMIRINYAITWYITWPSELLLFQSVGVSSHQVFWAFSKSKTSGIFFLVIFFLVILEIILGH